MAENTAHPVGGIDYPRTLMEFDDWFASEAACADFLRRVRWPAGFRCPACGGTEAWVTGQGPTAMCGMPTSDVADRGDDLRGYAETVAALVPGDVVCDESEARRQCAWGSTNTRPGRLSNGLDMAP